MSSSSRAPAWIAVVSFLFVLSASAFAGELKPNHKRGQVYFKMVCTVCHLQTVEKTIPPASRTMDEWQAYFDANQHAAGSSDPRELAYYMSREYRESIQDHNKAAKKFLKLPGEQIFADVREFSIKGAKDSDTPASCN